MTSNYGYLFQVDTDFSCKTVGSCSFISQKLRLYCETDEAGDKIFLFGKVFWLLVIVYGD